jgi:hypothetical protein
MKKAAEHTKTASKRIVATPRQIKEVTAAVKAVIGEEPDTFADVDEHPSSLDLPTQKPKITKLLADCECLPKGSAGRVKAFQRLLKILHDEYAK